MSLYNIIVVILTGIFRLFNGKMQVQGQEHIPKNRPFILAATHRSLLDPIILAILLYPESIAFMAKDSLFKNKLLGPLLRKVGMIPVNRDRPGTSTIKASVRVLQEDQRILGIFPSGSRHKTELKSGTAFIQGLSRHDILPVAIQPTQSFWDFIRRKPQKVAFGPLIPYQPDKKYCREDYKAIDKQLEDRFHQLDQALENQTPARL